MGWLTYRYRGSVHCHHSRDHDVKDSVVLPSSWYEGHKTSADILAQIQSIGNPKAHHQWSHTWTKNAKFTATKQSLLMLSPPEITGPLIFTLSHCHNQILFHDGDQASDFLPCFPHAVHSINFSFCYALKTETRLHMQILFLWRQLTVSYMTKMDNFKTLRLYIHLRRDNPQESEVIELERNRLGSRPIVSTWESLSQKTFSKRLEVQMF